MTKLIASLCLSLGLTALAQAQVSVQQEVELGRQAAQQIEAQVGIDNSAELNQRLQKVAQTLVPVCGINDINYSFKVLNSDEFNAMALPGGFIYATRKLVRTLSDGPLTFVLGHELAHVTQRHSIRQMESEQMRKIGLMAILLGLGQGRINNQSAQLAGLADQVISSRFSQADEDEADRLGAAMLSRAQLDRAYTLVGLHVLADQAGGGGMPQFVNAILGSHPLPKERIEAAYSYIPKLEYQPSASAQQSSNPQWEGSLERGLIQATGLRANAELKARAADEVRDQRFDREGILLVSPAGESLSSFERRLYTQDLAWALRKTPVPTQFGLSLRQTAGGDNLLWIRLR